MPSHPRSSHNSSHTKSSRKLTSAIKEVRSNPPSTLKKGQGKKERMRQLLAIAFSKARKRGARLPRRK